jgi:SAM-dependent methyltransferase
MLDRIKNIFEKLLACTGKNVTCACCGKHAKRFFPAGVVTKRIHARCAFCGSLERHRLVAIMIKQFPFTEKANILCIAPEAPLTNFLKSLFLAKITTLDLLRQDVDIQGDVCALPFSDHTFDAVIANHVLEHVNDDIQAMCELRRILKPNGRAILQTPIHWDLEKTEEDTTAGPEECLRRFGQKDHVRLYGRDFMNKLHSVDWEVQMLPVSQNFSKGEIYKNGLEENEVFFKITRLF